MSLIEVILLSCLLPTSIWGQSVSRGFVCEHGTLNLRCGANTKIYVVSASYGRNSPGLCTNGPIHVSSGCHSSSSLSKVRDACHGRPSCSIQASNSVFGDPCYGTFKYLEVYYRCLEIPTEIVCEHSTLSLSCQEDLRIHILAASYGRSTGPEICPHQAIPEGNCCHASSSLRVLQDTCERQQSCSITASNSIFGDPCYGTFKYLEVAYRCQASRLVCEHSTLSLRCPGNSRLNIIYANYGRNAGGEICPNRSVQVTNGCGATSSLSRVQEACQGRQSCSIQASNSIFGDPCYGTYKYLEVTYSCE